MCFTDGAQKWQPRTRLVASSVMLPGTFRGELVVVFLGWALWPSDSWGSFDLGSA